MSSGLDMGQPSGPTADALSLFTREYGGSPEAVASAPGRVNLIGEHVDYNGGDVLPIAIHLRTCVAIRRRTGSESVAVSTGERTRTSIAEAAETASGSWGDYLAAILRTFRARAVAVPALEIAIASDVPAGAGLSSSAALEVALGRAVAALLGESMDDRELALLAWKAESEFVGVPCGIMDQFASALARNGHALHIECAQITSRSVPFNEPVLVFDTAAPRALRGSAFAVRRAECEQALRAIRRVRPGVTALAAASIDDLRAARLPEPLDRRARHVVEEQERVRRAVQALLGGGEFPGELLLASHQSLRDQYECSTAELDWFVEQARRADGVRGARLTGGGWGGCAMALGERAALWDTAQSLTREYREQFGRSARSWITAASDGARIEHTSRAEGIRR